MMTTVEELHQSAMAEIRNPSPGETEPLTPIARELLREFFAGLRGEPVTPEEASDSEGIADE